MSDDAMDRAVMVGVEAVADMHAMRGGRIRALSMEQRGRIEDDARAVLQAALDAEAIALTPKDYIPRWVHDEQKALTERAIARAVAAEAERDRVKGDLKAAYSRLGKIEREIQRADKCRDNAEQRRNEAVEDASVFREQWRVVESEKRAAEAERDAAREDAARLAVALKKQVYGTELSIIERVDSVNNALAAHDGLVGKTP